MATETKNTDPFNGVATDVDSKATGEEISADSFQQMVDILDSLLEHQHNFTDTYISNCECECGGGGTI